MKLNKKLFSKKYGKYALLFMIGAMTALNTGFSAPNEVTQPNQAEEITVEPTDEMKQLIAAESQNLPSGITVSDSGSITLADNGEHKKMLAAAVRDALEKVENAEELQPVMDALEAGRFEVVEWSGEPETNNEMETVSNVTPVEEPANYDDGSSYAAVMAMEATAYLPTDGSGEGITAMGVPATYGIAAVDPSIIPLGSRLYIPGYGEALAADTGGAIYGYRIDLCMESYDEAMQFGRRTITVYVLK